MYTESNLSAVKVFIAAATKFGVLEEALVSAMDHLKHHKDASIEEALSVGLMDWDVHKMIDQWEKEQQDIEDSLPF